MTATRREALADSQREADELASPRVSEVTPSKRDFIQYVTTHRTELAVIARIAGDDTARAIAHARACDDAEVAALCVATESGQLRVSDMAAISVATTAPILRSGLTLDPRQLYHARLHAADAVICPAAEVGADGLRELVAIACSLHMAAVIEAQSPADIAVALTLPHVAVGLWCTTESGAVDVPRSRELAHAVPKDRCVIALPAIASIADAEALRGAVDAIVVGTLLETADADAMAPLVRRLSGAA